MVTTSGAYLSSYPLQKIFEYLPRKDLPKVRVLSKECLELANKAEFFQVVKSISSRINRSSFSGRIFKDLIEFYKFDLEKMTRPELSLLIKICSNNTRYFLKANQHHLTREFKLPLPSFTFDTGDQLGVQQAEEIKQVGIRWLREKYHFIPNINQLSDEEIILNAIANGSVPLGQLFEYAAENGFPRWIQLLGPSISISQIEEGLFLSAIWTRFDAFQEMVNLLPQFNNNLLSSEAVKRALKEAFYRGGIKCILAILNSSYFKDNKNIFPDLEETLNSYIKAISSSDLGVALVSAAANENSELLRTIIALPQFNEIHTSFLEKSLIKSKIYHHNDCYNDLVHCKRYHEISSKTLLFAKLADLEGRIINCFSRIIP